KSGADVGVVRFDREADVGRACGVPGWEIPNALVAREEVHPAQKKGEPRTEAVTRSGPLPKLGRVARAVERHHEELRRAVHRSRRDRAPDEDHRYENAHGTRLGWRRCRCASATRALPAGTLTSAPGVRPFYR